MPARIEGLVKHVEPRVLAWFQDLHRHPELGHQEVRTSGLVAEHLRSLSIEIHTGVGETGVVGLLRGAAAGPVVALRADMDALPVTERTGLPYASEARTVYRGEEVGVMHACGHDAHTAVLMGAAEVLSGLRSELAGTVMFVFQPAEEASLPGERSGAELMLEEGLFDRIAKPAAIFALHTLPSLRAGQFAVREGPAMASEDHVVLVVRGKSTHASRPWDGIDPVTTAAQILTSLQTIVSRQLNIARAPAVLSFGSIRGGVHANVIPDEVTVEGTLRTFDPDMRSDIQKRLERLVEGVAASAGAAAELTFRPVNPVTVNAPELVRAMRPTLEAVAGRENVLEAELILGSEDFANFASRVPGMYAFMGVTGPGRDPRTAPAYHSAYFQVDPETFVPAVTAMSRLALDYLSRSSPR